MGQPSLEAARHDRKSGSYQSPRAISKFAQMGLTIAAIVASLAVPLHLVGAGRDTELTLNALSHVLGIGVGTLAFHRGLLNLRALTKTHIMSGWNSAIIGFGPVVFLGLVGWLIVSSFFNIPPPIKVAAQLLGIAGYAGWLLSALAWPFIWLRLLGIRADGRSRSRPTTQLLVWTAFTSSSASFVAQYLKLMDVDGMTAQILSSMLAVSSLIVSKQMMQELDRQQHEAARRLGGVVDESPPVRILINLSPSAMWAILLFSLSIYAAALVLDANRIVQLF